MDNEKFIELFNEIARKSNAISESKGWFVKDDPESLSSKIALIHSELSEALEAIRHGNPPSDHIPEFSGMEEEFADAILRMMHVGAALKLNIGGAIVAKIDFNAGREYKHGGKKF